MTRRLLVAAMTIAAAVSLASTGAEASVSPRAASSAVSVQPRGQRHETGAAADLAAVAVIPRTADAWAVGQRCGSPSVCPAAGPSLILRLSSSRWSPVKAPSPGGRVTLTSVAASSRSNAWAVGSYDGSENKNLFLHWNGTSWKQIRGPSENSGWLYGVAAASPANAWAVGTYGSPPRTLILHWNGRIWTKIATPHPGSSGSELYAVTAVSGDDVWAVGNALLANSTYQPLILHWNGHTWKTTRTPRTDTLGTRLSGVAAAGRSDVWAVGQYDNPNDFNNPLIFHWNGDAWSRSAAPGMSTNLEELNAVTATSPAHAWAVGLGPCVGGSINCPSHSLIMRWSNRSWKTVRSVSIHDGKDQNVLNGVAATSASNAWAVGSYYPAAQGDPVRALLLHWNGTSWTER